MEARDPDSAVLIAEDDPALRDLMLTLLRDEGYAASACSDGRIALARARVAPPALLLLDVRLPGLDGTAVCRRLTADRRTRRVPVVFVTAEPRDEVDRALGDCPCEGFLAKPFDLADALATVADHCP